MKTRARGGDQPARGAGGQRMRAARAASSGTGPPSREALRRGLAVALAEAEMTPGLLREARPTGTSRGPAYRLGNYRTMSQPVGLNFDPFASFLNVELVIRVVAPSSMMAVT